jgi:hypothetical protein
MVINRNGAEKLMVCLFRKIRCGKLINLNSGKTGKNVITQTFFFVYPRKEEYSPIAAICPVLHTADGQINDMNGTERSDKRVASSDGK